MKRDPTKSGYFVGTEVENTNYRGYLTLFVVGKPPSAQKIHEVAETAAGVTAITHIYLAANQSWASCSVKEWATAAGALRDMGYLVSLDIPYGYYPQYLEYTKLLGHTQLVISVPLPEIQRMNAVVKIDDDVRSITNPGVWVHKMTQEGFTPWAAYQGDSSLKDFT